MSCGAVHLDHLVYLEDFLEMWSKELNKECLSTMYCIFAFSSIENLTYSAFQGTKYRANEIKVIRQQFIKQF